MKKVTCFLLTIVCILSLSVNVHAENNIKGQMVKKDTAVRISEYQKVQELKQKSDGELKKLGLNDILIKELRNLDFAKELSRRAKLSSTELEQMGYNKMQIILFRNFKGTESEIIALSPILEITQSASVQVLTTNPLPTKQRLGGSIYSSLNYFWNDGHDCSIGFSWGWTAEPLITTTDLIGFGWSAMAGNGSLLGSYITRSECIITYVCANLSDQQENSPIVPEGSGKAHTAIKMLNPKYQNNSWAKSGHGYLNIHSDGVLGSVEFRTAYGHSSLSSTPSISVGAGVSFSFSPSYSISEEDYSYHIF